ncbi:MAG: hypothetical protein JXK05_09665 [Campylobacterales bacterium]|nr:hypothetical protein [Campylobacterales bacterium]
MPISTDTAQWQENMHLAYMFENPDNQNHHYMGSHWDGFFDDLDDRMPSIVQNAENSKIRNEEPVAPIPFEPAFDLPRCRQLCYPDATNGYAYVIGVNKSDRSQFLASLYPLINAGALLEGTLEENDVIVWEGGFEAQINFPLGPASISFYDTGFYKNWPLYAAGERYTFRTIGIAYYAMRPEQMEMEIEVTDIQRRIYQIEPDQKTMTLSLKGMVSIVPVEGWDIDEFSIRGVVMAVEEYIALEFPGWILTMQVVRRGDDGFNLDVFVSKKAWESESDPKIGDDVEAKIWLQGELAKVF